MDSNNPFIIDIHDTVSQEIKGIIQFEFKGGNFTSPHIIAEISGVSRINFRDFARFIDEVQIIRTKVTVLKDGDPIPQPIDPTTNITQIPFTIPIESPISGEQLPLTFKSNLGSISYTLKITFLWVQVLLNSVSVEIPVHIVAPWAGAAPPSFDQVVGAGGILLEPVSPPLSANDDGDLEWEDNVVMRPKALSNIDSSGAGGAPVRISSSRDGKRGFNDPEFLSRADRVLNRNRDLSPPPLANSSTIGDDEDEWTPLPPPDSEFIEATTVEPTTITHTGNVTRSFLVDEQHSLLSTIDQNESRPQQTREHQPERDLSQNVPSYVSQNMNKSDDLPPPPPPQSQSNMSRSTPISILPSSTSSSIQPPDYNHSLHHASFNRAQQHSVSPHHRRLVGRANSLPTPYVSRLFPSISSSSSSSSSSSPQIPKFQIIFPKTIATPGDKIPIEILIASIPTSSQQKLDRLEFTLIAQVAAKAGQFEKAEWNVLMREVVKAGEGAEVCESGGGDSGGLKVGERKRIRMVVPTAEKMGSLGVGFVAPLLKLNHFIRVKLYLTKRNVVGKIVPEEFTLGMVSFILVRN
ncbi:hypothetical protein HDU76_003714 [Blyttiomyces sp. JEL0837]|nr:hypothetical protein HDU76_003714 [Blyttiomyces sp. JEL0837]